MKGHGKMAKWDRITRITIGIILVITTLAQLFPTNWYPYAYILTAIGIANIVFPIIGWCPLYAAVGFSTCKIRNK